MKHCFTAGEDTHRAVLRRRHEIVNETIIITGYLYNISRPPFMTPVANDTLSVVVVVRHTCYSASPHQGCEKKCLAISHLTAKTYRTSTNTVYKKL